MKSDLGSRAAPQVEGGLLTAARDHFGATFRLAAAPVLLMKS